MHCNLREVPTIVSASAPAGAPPSMCGLPSGSVCSASDAAAGGRTLDMSQSSSSLVSPSETTIASSPVDDMRSSGRPSRRRNGARRERERENARVTA